MKQQFIVPDYYPRFQCKGGSCRNTCCSSWGIHISMKQYFKLLNLPCEEPLKSKIERAFMPRLHPTPDQYAELRHTYEGYCPLLLENGYCGLHSACGVEALPDVCKTYPRSVQSSQNNQACCVNSCEKTLELLLETTDSLHFIPYDIEIDSSALTSIETMEKQQSMVTLQAFCYSLLSNRSDSFPLRMYKMGQVLTALDKNKQVDVSSFEFKTELCPFQLEKSFSLIQTIALWFAERNRSIEEFRQIFIQIEEDSIFERYHRKLTHLYSVIPNHDSYLEKVVVNQLFYRQFPFTFEKRSFTDHLLGLVGMVLFIRYLTMSFMVNRTSMIDYVDVLARAFRVIAHSSFEHNMILLLQNEGICDLESLSSILAF